MMNKLFKIFSASLMISLAGCGTMNSHFSCNVTAGDSCLTIEEVDAMTRFADDRPSKLKARSPVHYTKVKGQTIWVALGLKGQS
jgi:conjugal transfer pilus assembly protein TraV